MEVSTLLAGITFLAAVSAEADTDYLNYNYDYDHPAQGYDDYEVPGWWVPFANGSYFWVAKDDWNNTIEMYSSGSAEFYLYTNLNPDEPTRLYPNDVDSITSSNFDNTNPTRILAHGFNNDKSSDFCLEVRRTLIAVEACNVIVVDWSSMSSVIYPSARSAVPRVGKKIAEFIDFLNSKIGMPFEDLTLIGYSLGAHVCGFAGKEVKNGKVDVIIGLDPASPLFDYDDATNRLHETDANVVETIQTSTLLGFHAPIGKASFFPNGGRSQPGCDLDLLKTCAHARSYIYYCEAILSDSFKSIKCETRDAAESECGKDWSDVRMGLPKKYRAEGIYYVPVNENPHYGKG